MAVGLDLMHSDNSSENLTGPVGVARSQIQMFEIVCR